MEIYIIYFLFLNFCYWLSFIYLIQEMLQWEDVFSLMVQQRNKKCKKKMAGGIELGKCVSLYWTTGHNLRLFHKLF